MSTETEASGPDLGAGSDDGPADLQAAAAASFRAAATSWAFVYPRGWWTADYWTADYWTERRGLEKILQVSFTTPFVPLREAMLELFDAIVLSLHPVVRG
ncbi:hypothetical protein [Promicromonospora sp. NPDC023987]|uniref:hypothetical protein n=1 Tax=Promicromonospora sp. NPDC023987 TaxID=3155360 RepID=UPI0033FDA484